MYRLNEEKNVCTNYPYSSAYTRILKIQLNGTKAPTYTDNNTAHTFVFIKENLTFELQRAARRTHCIPFCIELLIVLRLMTSTLPYLY